MSEDRVEDVDEAIVGVAMFGEWGPWVEVGFVIEGDIRQMEGGDEWCRRLAAMYGARWNPPTEDET